MTLPAVVALPENALAVIVPVDGLIVTVDTVELAAPERVPDAGVKIIGWFVFVVAATTLTFCPVVAYPVRFPENAPENVVAVKVPVDGTYDNEPLDDKPVPVVVVAAPLNTGYTVDAVFVVATLIFDEVVAVAEFPDKVPLKVVAVIVLVEGLIVTVDTVEVAAPETVPVAGVNVIGWLAFVVAATTLTF